MAFRAPEHRGAEYSPVAAALAADRVGVPSVLSFVLSGVAPATVVAGVVTSLFAVTGLTAIPAAFVVVAAVLAVFAVGYVAMARHLRNAGVFYAYIGAGLSPVAGVPSAMIAVVAYNLLQVGLYGAFGVSAAGLLADKLDWHASWWVWSLIAWAAVAVLGQQRVDFNGRVAAVLGAAEILVVVILTIAGLSHPAGGSVDFSTLNPANLAHDGVGALLATAVLGYVGFESSAVFAEESKQGSRTVALATYSSLGLIVVLYALASWALPVHYGVDQVATVAQQQGPGMLFSLAGDTLANVANVLFLSSLFAAMVAFHNTAARYSFALGRDRVFPAALQRTSRGGAPSVASAVQSVFGLAVIGLYAAAGWDPFVQLFFWLGTTGGVGILLLLAITSVSTVVFFLRDPRGEPTATRLVAPAAAGVALVVMSWLAIHNYATLLGVAPGSKAAFWLPASYAIAALLGLVLVLAIRATRPAQYAALNATSRYAVTLTHTDPSGVPTGNTYR
jgi:amino acid transporter